MKDNIIFYLGSVVSSLILGCIFYHVAEIRPDIEMMKYIIGASFIPVINSILSIMLLMVFAICTIGKLIYYVGDLIL